MRPIRIIVRCAALISEAGEDLVVPALVLAELDYWCARRLPPIGWRTFLEDVLAGVYRVESPRRGRVSDLEPAVLQTTYADMGIGIVDASVIALAERLRERRRLVTLDHRHFRVVRPAHVETLELLPV